MPRMRKIQKKLTTNSSRAHTQNVYDEMRTHPITQNTDKKVSACEVDYINIIMKNKSIHMSDCTPFTTGILQDKRIENISNK